MVLRVVLGGLVLGCFFLAQATGSWVRGRLDGAKAAEEDIARGTPWIREHLGYRVDVDSGGFGIDRETGLPLENTWLLCSHGVDFTTYRAENDAYNDTIRDAFAAGKLAAYSLRHTVRTAEGIGALFAASRPTELGDRGVLRIVRPERWMMFVVYEVRHDGHTRRSDEVHDLEVSALGREPRTLSLRHPIEFVRGPLAAVVTDGQTTVILRDADDFAWVIDLPRGVIVQVVGPVP